MLVGLHASLHPWLQVSWTWQHPTALYGGVRWWHQAGRHLPPGSGERQGTNGDDGNGREWLKKLYHVFGYFRGFTSSQMMDMFSDFRINVHLVGGCWGISHCVWRAGSFNLSEDVIRKPYPPCRQLATEMDPPTINFCDFLWVCYFGVDTRPRCGCLNQSNP